MFIISFIIEFSTDDDVPVNNGVGTVASVCSK